MAFDTLTADADDATLVQRVLLDRADAVRGLYWREVSRDAGCRAPGLVTQAQDGLSLQPRALAAFDTYFNAMFEHHWRLYTRLGALALRIEVRGRARVRLFRRTPHGGDALLREVLLCGDLPVMLDAPTEHPHFRQAGLLWFEIEALDQPVTLTAASWHAAGSKPDEVGLAVVICTFNRETDLARVLSALVSDPVAASRLSRIIVVSQGRPGLSSHPDVATAVIRLGRRLRIVEQGNFGGAGGFGRGMIEALDDPDVTHVCLLDDDVRVEPESLMRMASFFGLATAEVSVGGHMLDSMAPTWLYEAGAVITPKWAPQPLQHRQCLADPATLTALLVPEAVHFNGWWCFGVSRAVIERLGLPLPCFIRGDDIELGLRLHAHGVATVPLPGVAIWHEPFYLKIGGWQLYYETRNMLVWAALYLDFTPRQVATLMLKRLLTELLTYRYYNAALIVRGMEDFLRGPMILENDPAIVHASLGPLQQAYPNQWSLRERVVPAARVGQSPRWRPGFVGRMLGVLVRNALSATRADAPPRLLDIRNLVWFRVAGEDSLAVDTHWDRHLPVFRRDRAAFRALLRSGLAAIRTLYRAAPSVQAEWRSAVPRLTSQAFWRAYLGMASTAVAVPEDHVRSDAA